jgi:hypothetical protein
MAYKSKICPQCGVTHNKRGEYCSRSCGNKKKHTAETKAKIAETKREWHATSETAAVVAHEFTSKRINAPDEPVPPQTHTPLGNRQFVEDGDLWTEM